MTIESTVDTELAPESGENDAALAALLAKEVEPA